VLTIPVSLALQSLAVTADREARIVRHYGRSGQIKFSRKGKLRKLRKLRELREEKEMAGDWQEARGRMHTLKSKVESKSHETLYCIPSLYSLNSLNLLFLCIPCVPWFFLLCFCFEF
jgi:hypothetical protein